MQYDDYIKFISSHIGKGQKFVVRGDMKFIGDFGIVGDDGLEMAGEMVDKFKVAYPNDIDKYILWGPEYFDPFGIGNKIRSIINLIYGKVTGKLLFQYENSLNVSSELTVDMLYYSFVGGSIENGIKMSNQSLKGRM